LSSEWSLPFRLSNQILYTFLISPMRGTCLVHVSYMSSSLISFIKHRFWRWKDMTSHILLFTALDPPGYTDSKYQTLGAVRNFLHECVILNTVSNVLIAFHGLLFSLLWLIGLLLSILLTLVNYFNLNTLTDARFEVLLLWLDTNVSGNHTASIFRGEVSGESV
jgi:hypothetical protein